MKRSTIRKMPNVMTCMRLIMIPSFYYAFIHPGMIFPGRGFALAVFAAASLTDAMDGYIARKYAAVSSFGKLADPVADKALVLTAIYCLYTAGQLGGWYVVAVCIKEAVLIIGGLFMLSNRIVTQSGVPGKAACAFTMAGIGLALAGLRLGELVLYGALMMHIVAMMGYIMAGIARLRSGAADGAVGAENDVDAAG